jgi:hypothetical protein
MVMVVMSTGNINHPPKPKIQSDNLKQPQPLLCCQCLHSEGRGIDNEVDSFAAGCRYCHMY